MREIKFRAWDINAGEMQNWDFLQENADLRELFDEPNIFIPLQYTGLKDKNGKEVYEGDIIAYGGDNHNGVVVFGEFEGAMAFYTEEGAKLRGDDKQKRIHGLPPTTDIPEVIGNIYEHPRLARRWGKT